VDRTGQRRVGVLIVALAALAAALWCLAAGLPGYRPTAFMMWIIVAVLSAAAERFVLHIQIRREAQAVSLSEIPLVLGLFLATPVDFGIGRVLGMFAACVLWRRSSPIKIAFNVVQVALESAVAVLVFHGVLAGVSHGSPGEWLATLAATGVVGGLSALSITAVIALADGSLRRRDLWREPALGALTSAATSVGGLIAVILMEQSPWNGLLGLAALTGLLYAYRAYAGLAERHLSLERLHRFSQAVSDHPERDQVLHTILSRATEILHAARAEILFLPGTPDSEAIRIGAGRHGVLVRTPGAVTGPWAEVVQTGEPMIIARTTRDAGERDFLTGEGMRDGLIVPLRGDAGLIGALMVADRLGDVRTFDADDVTLLETVAAHAAVAVGKGRLVDQLEHDAMHDALTGLPNRAGLGHRLEELLAAGETRVAVLVMDLDDFKKVNDTLGHHHGDALLQHVASALRDAVDESVTVGRLGGDEFAVLMPHGPDPRDAVDLGGRLLAALRAPALVGDIRLQVSASMGVAVGPQHGEDAATLLRHADMAMYEAKNTHRGITVFDPTGRVPESPAQLALAGELREGLGRGELRLYVQPKADAHTGEIVSVEALVRWQHPRHGLLMPDEFIPIAERNGLIKALTDEVLAAAITAAAGWAADGTPVSIAVNLSPRSLLGTDLAGQIAALLAARQASARLLTLELTESSMMNDPNGVAALMADLHRMGVRLSIDDFGTGYSSLSTLRKLPLDEIKIDKSFVMGLRDSTGDETIVRSVVDLGRNLGLDVVAEGVENEQIWHVLRRMGCTQIQVYYLTRPIPVADFPAWLAEYHREPEALLVGVIQAADQYPQNAGVEEPDLGQVDADLGDLPRLDLFKQQRLHGPGAGHVQFAAEPDGGHADLTGDPATPDRRLLHGHLLVRLDGQLRTRPMITAEARPWPDTSPMQPDGKGRRSYRRRRHRIQPLT
jgi:diguanylate cyclase (GGDEF)-like protein